MDELQLEVADYTDLDHWRWRLTDAGGAFLADYTVALDRAAPLYQAFVDLYPYLQYYAAPDRQLEHEAELLAEVGHWIGAQVWGPVGEKMLEAAPVTVHVRLPAAMAGLAYRPLELGYVQDYPLALQEVSLVFEVGEPRPPGSKQPINEALRMLAVFSLPTDTSVLGLRQERYALKRLIQRIALTQRRAIELRVLQYGVTRDILRETLEEGEGWDLIHFSGHGLPAGLLLELPDGRQDRISVHDLERLLRPARPRLKLVTLSACESAAPTVQETLRWLQLAEPQRSEQAQVDEAATATPSDPLPALARSLAENLDCAVLAMRYPVGDAFAIEFAGRLYRALLEQRRALPAALQLALPQALPPRLQPGIPPLSVAAPTLFGSRAATLTLALPGSPPRPFDVSAPGMADFPPEPEYFVGRAGPMTRASIAMAPESGQTAVLLYGMAGAGKTACALELAYRYASNRFEAFAWHKAPDEGHDIAAALLRLAGDLERQLPGFTMAHVVDRMDALTAWLPRLTELLERHSILIVLDNLESLLTPEGRWRDARWEALVRALVAHGGFSRTVLTSRRRPVALGDDPRVVVEAIHALSLPESVLFARELPHLGALLRGESATGFERGWVLVRNTLAVVQGHPQLLTLAEAQAKDPEALAGYLARAASAWGAGAVTLQAFFQEGESRQPAEAFLSALAGWTREVAGGLPSAPRFLFHVLCALEDEDRQERVVEANWGTVWRLLGQPGEVPPLAETFSRIVEVSLVESQLTGDGETRYALHPGVAEVGRVETGEATQAAVDRALIVWWVNLFQYCLEHEGEGLGRVVSDSTRRAVPYLMRQQRWDAVVTLLERVISRDSSPATMAVVLPYLRHIAAVTASTGSRFALAKALRLASQEAEAEGLLRELIPEVDARGNVQLTAGATSELINVLQIMGHLEEALELCDAQQAYTRKAGFGRWTQLKDEGQRLQILALLGRTAEVVTAVQALRGELHTLPEVSSQEEAVDPWNARELILDAGHTAALNLGRWEDALTLNAELIALNEERGASALEVASTRFNDYSPLLRLGRTTEAATLLHACRAVFEAAEDLKLLSLLFTALADLEVARNRPEAAITFEETALRYSYRIGDARACATAHFNLADDVRRAGGSPAVALAHQLAAGVIDFQTGDGRLARSLRLLARDCAGFAPEPPPLPASFDALCVLVEQVEGVRFGELVERLPRRAPTGEAVLAEVLRQIQEQTASMTDAEDGPPTGPAS